MAMKSKKHNVLSMVEMKTLMPLTRKTQLAQSLEDLAAYKKTEDIVNKDSQAVLSPFPQRANYWMGLSIRVHGDWRIVASFELFDTLTILKRIGGRLLLSSKIMILQEGCISGGRLFLFYTYQSIPYISSVVISSAALTFPQAVVTLY
ncbi:hypothetical protein Tco_0154459 [Tanacetum coccineum]